MNFGAGMLAGFLGCRVNVRPETVWFEPAGGADLGRVSLELQTDGYWWRRAMDLTTRAAQRMGDRVQISHVDLGGNADILASMVGTERLLMELIDRPNEAAAAMRRITELWLRAYDLVYEPIRQWCPGTVPWAPVWAPGTAYMLQSDFCYMISPEMFRRFILPDLEACCEHLEYPFYHLDGVGELPHLDMLLGIRKLRGIQWVPGDGKPPADQWPDLLRRIRDGGKLCQVSVSADGARRICREVGGRGFLFLVRTPLTPAQARELYEELTA
jgi:5-methyltetrahydrofolate--homocysteine methyltransferase